MGCGQEATARRNNRLGRGAATRSNAASAARTIPNAGAGAEAEAGSKPLVGSAGATGAGACVASDEIWVCGEEIRLGAVQSPACGELVASGTAVG